MNLKLAILALLSINLLASNIKINAINYHNKSGIYNVYDGDILFTKIDNLKLSITSDKNEVLHIDYIFEGKVKNLGSVTLTKNTAQEFPSEEDDYLNFDEEGDVSFVFRNRETVLKKFSIKYIANKTPKNSSTVQNTNLKYGIDPNIIIGNQRGNKEKEAYNRLIKSTVIIETPDELGSGIVISKDGKVLTNYHVVKNNAVIELAFKPKLKHQTQPLKNSFLKAKVLKTDSVRDLALLQILDKQALEGIEFIELSSLDEVDIGEDVYTMGHPQNELFTIGYGIVSQVRQNYRWNSHKADYVIQTQSATSKGNSGGPLIDENYKLIGLNTFSNIKGQNLNFAISVYDIKEFLSTSKTKKVAIQSCIDLKNYKQLSVKNGIDKNNIPLAQYELDSNDNNIKDLEAIDVSNDGVYNYLLFDFDEDGSYDKKSYDKDGDGICERTEYF